MNTALFYGIVLALVNIVLTLVAFFLGYQTDKLAQGQWFALLAFLGMITVLWLGIRVAREEAGDKGLTYGRGLLTGVLISVYSGLFGAVYTFIHFAFVNPSFVDYYIDFARQKWIARGFGDAQMASLEKITRFMMSPALMSVWTVIQALLLGAIFSLILAAFLKRNPSGPKMAEAPPAG